MYLNQLKQPVLINFTKTKSLNFKNATMKYFFRTTVQTQNTFVITTAVICNIVLFITNKYMESQLHGTHYNS